MKKKHSPKSKTFPPDWKDPTQYPAPETTTGTQWAWEFLRRNPKYQADYEQAKKPMFTQYIFEGSDKQKLLLGNTRKKKVIPRKNESPEEFKARFVKYHIVPPPDGELAREWEKVGFEDAWLKDLAAPFWVWVQRKYGLKLAFTSLPDPKDEGVNNLAFQFPLRVSCLFEKGEMYMHGEEREIYEVGLNFDLRQSIPQQIKIAEKFLKKRQKEIGGIPQPNKKTTHKLREYLRLLDAEFSGIGRPEMARVIFPVDTKENSRQKVYAGLVAAKEIRDFSYASLAKIRTRC